MVEYTVACLPCIDGLLADKFLNGNVITFDKRNSAPLYSREFKNNPQVVLVVEITDAFKCYIIASCDAEGKKAFMSPRYPGGPRGPGPVRMPPNQVDFNTPGSGSGPIMPNSMEPRPGHPGMGPMGPRMPHGRMPGPMNPYDSLSYGGMRGPPPNNMGPVGPGMPPMSMSGGQGSRPWAPTTSSINYSSASPGSYNGPGGGGPPGTPIMPSPQGSQGPFSPASHQRMSSRPGDYIPNDNMPDSTNSGDGMYGMMKGGPGLPGMPGQFPGMSGGPEGGMGMGPDMGQVMNGGDIDGMKNSPANGPGTPPVSMPGYVGDGLSYQDNDQTESAAILKIKECMAEEAKRFEKDTDQPDYFMSQ
uniref:Single-stranded DNA-binding protein 3 n=1 Tax=Magallana gigas TaxID=29159 RepID=A0A8W8P097_MAGGI